MINQSQTRNDEFHFFDLWDNYKRFWPWFAMSIAFCIGIAILYVYLTPKSYSRTAIIMIKNDARRDISTALNDKIIVSMNSDVKNEVEAFRSPKLIQDVIRRLNIETVYSYKKRLKKVNLYIQGPINVSFPDASDDDSFGFEVDIKPDSMVILSKFRYKKIGLEGKVHGKLRDTISTPVGNVVILPTVYFGNQWYMVPMDVSKKNVQDEAHELLKKLVVNIARKDNSVINIEYVDTNISRAEDFLNTLITVYNENWIYEKNKYAESTSKTLSERLPLIKNELDELDRQLAQYKSQHLLTNVQSVGSHYQSLSSNYSSKIVEVNTQINVAQIAQEFLKENDNINTYMPYSGLSNAVIESQIMQYNNLLLERDAAMTTSSEKNSKVAGMNSRLETMRHSIKVSVDNQIVTLKKQLSDLQAQETRMTQQLASNPVQERQLVIIERERKTKEETYLYLMQKKEENDMSLVIDAINTRIISPPTGTDIPVKPNKILALIMAICFGVMIPSTFVLGKESVNTAIRGKEDLEGLSVPLLGVIASSEKEDRNSGVSLLVSETGRDMVNETFRMVRTSVDTTCDKDTKVVMFTSFEPGCGKTFTALNLAMTFALTGKKVALLDVDMRTAMLSSVIETSESSRDLGICSFLNGNATYRQLLQFIIQKNRYYSGFDVFPVGSIPPNPTELLMDDRFGKMLESLKKKYDYVFLDCTPLDLVTDATIISKHADLSIFIVREGHTDRRKLRDLEKTYKNGIFKNMYLVLNDSRLNIAFNKYHTRYNAKIKEVAKLPRATAPGKMKYLTEGKNKSHESNPG